MRFLVDWVVPDDHDYMGCEGSDHSKQLMNPGRISTWS